jgi:hypothetical protein
MISTISGIAKVIVRNIIKRNLPKERITYAASEVPVS